jgi:phosphohistidine phosphatase
MQWLVHHADAVGPQVDAQRPLSERGRAAVARLAQDAASRGVKPAAIWHSGKLRARQTAEAFWRACNPLGEFTATRGLQPEDAPELVRDQLLGEERDVMLVGHMPNIDRLHALLLKNQERQPFPLHGLVALEFDGRSWKEIWRSPEPAWR